MSGLATLAQEQKGFRDDVCNRNCSASPGSASLKQEEALKDLQGFREMQYTSKGAVAHGGQGAQCFSRLQWYIPSLRLRSPGPAALPAASL